MFSFCSCKLSIIIIIVIAFLFYSCVKCDVVQATSHGECLSPGGRPGVCKNINECKSLIGLLVKSKSRPSSWVFDFLRRSHCGFEGKDPVVCCPITVKSKETQGKVNHTTHVSPSGRLFNESCGSIQTLDKIIGGSITGLHEFPWMALIGYKTRNRVEFRCGGSLISDRYVLTAAHCITNLKDIQPTTVRLGEYDLSTSKDCDSENGCDPPAKDVEIEELIPHPEYQKPDLRNDIALVRLVKRVEFKDWILPICLPLDIEIRERSIANRKAVVAGWGITDSGSKSQVLRKITIPILPLSECTKVYQRRVLISDSQICAGGEAGKDSCSGDSGGPLQVMDINSYGEPIYVQRGIVSFGPRNCGTKGFPGVYTKVAFYVDWIVKNVKD